MYLKQTNGTVVFPYNLSQLKKDFPNISFPSPISESDLNAHGVYRVINGQKPLNDESSYYTLGFPYQDSNDMWVIDYNKNLYPESVASQNVKKKRTDLLEECDWTQLPDSPLSDSDKTAWATYRQALRDVPSQEGFPFTITWPTKP